MTADWVVAVRAALPSPRPQAWQAFQQAVGLAAAGPRRVTLVGDAAIPVGVPASFGEWLGRPLPPSLVVLRPARWHRPPLAGVLFRHTLSSLRRRDANLLCRDARVAAAEAGRWRRVVLEWHVRPDPRRRQDRAALGAADLHVPVAGGLADDLLSAGVPAGRVLLLPNACGLDPARAARRGRGGGLVVALGLHRRAGLDLALDAWALEPALPTLLLAGVDQDMVRVSAWAGRVRADARLLDRVEITGPAWGEAREDLIDRASAWLALYPSCDETVSRLCPLQAADAAGSGIIPVVTDLPSVRALLDGVPARYAAPHDALSVAREVTEALASEPAPFRPRPSWADRAIRLLEAAE